MILFFFERSSPRPRGRLHNWRLLQVLENQLMLVVVVVVVVGGGGGGGGEELFTAAIEVPSALTRLLRQWRS